MGEDESEALADVVALGGVVTAWAVRARNELA